MKRLVLAALISTVTVFGAQADGFDGRWKITWKGPFGYTYEELEIRKVNGTYLGRLATRNLTDLKIDGDQLSFSFSSVVPIGKIRMVFEGTRSDDSLSGNLNIIAPAPIPPGEWHSVRYRP